MATSLKRRRRSDPMRAYDALPAELRRWLAEAILPWSAASVQRLWLKTLKATRGDRQAACQKLTALERQQIARDVARIWDRNHPYLRASPDAATGPRPGNRAR